MALLLALLVLSATPAETSAPLDAVILGGGKRPDDAMGRLLQWVDRASSTSLAAPPGFPQNVESAQVAGMRPGVWVAILGYCRADASGPVLAEARKAFPDAYVRSVRGQAEACPQIVSPAARDLVTAAEKGDLEAVQRLLDSGGSVSARGARLGSAESPLEAAVRGSQAKVISLLLKRGADVSETTSHGEPLLELALDRGDVATVQALLAAGANARALLKGRGGKVYPGDEIPLAFLAACLGPPELTRAALGSGLSKLRSKLGLSALAYAAADCTLALPGEHASTREEATQRAARVSVLLDAGLDPNDQPATLNDAVENAIDAHHDELIPLLLAHHARVDRDNALFMAVQAKDEERATRLTNLLVDGGADARTQVSGMSAADIACEEGYLTLAVRLVKLGSPFGSGKPTAEKCRKHERPDGD